MNKIEALVKIANKQRGKQYEWGTAGPETFDCSGLVYYCVNRVQDPDISPEFRSSQRQWERLGRRVADSEALQTGDLLFWGEGQAEHVAILDYQSGGIVHAFNDDEGVVLTEFRGRSPWQLNMGTPYLGARRLFDGASTSGLDPKGQGSPKSISPPLNQLTYGQIIANTVGLIGPVGVSPATMPYASTISMSTSPTNISVTTPFRQLGDVTLEKWNEVMRGGNIGNPEACYEACKGYSALALAQAVKESSLGNAPGSREAFNPLGLLNPDGRTLKKFADWPLAFAEFKWRLTDPGYKAQGGKPGPYYAGDKGIVPGYDMSTLAFVITYVGGPDCLATRGQRCANGETYNEAAPKDGPEGLKSPHSINLYTAQLLKRIREWKGLAPNPTTPTQPTTGFQKITFAPGIEAYLPTGVLFRTVLTPKGPNRPGNRMTASSTTQHETGNTRVGAGANMHSQWQDGGTKGHPDGYVGVHFYVDDDQIIQKIPTNETSIHSGDWRNGTSISVERCVNADQTPFADSETWSAWLQASLLKYVVRKSAKEAMYPHYTNTVGQGTCPVNIGYHWSSYEDRVDRLIAQLP